MLSFSVPLQLPVLTPSSEYPCSSRPWLLWWDLCQRLAWVLAGVQSSAGPHARDEKATPCHSLGSSGVGSQALSGNWYYVHTREKRNDRWLGRRAGQRAAAACLYWLQLDNNVVTWRKCLVRNKFFFLKGKSIALLKTFINLLKIHHF